MSTSTASRNPVPLHLKSVLDHVLSNEALSKRQCQDMASALRTVAKALGRPLDELRANPVFLRDQLKAFTPAMADLSGRRWANALSLTRQALKYAGIRITHTPGRHREPFAPAWVKLFRPMEEKHARIALSRLARYCTVHGIAPEQVDDTTFQAFLHDLTTSSFVKLPRKVQQKAATVWNRMAASLPNWPGQRVAIPDYRRTYALPWSVFAASLKVDIEAYLEHLAPRNILDEMDFRPLKPASIRSRMHEIRAYISALVHRGGDPKCFLTLGDVVAIKVVKSGLGFFLDRAPKGSTAQAGRIAGMIVSLAHHWVKVDPDHLLALQGIRKRLALQSPGIGMAQKNRDRLRQFDDPDNVRKLLMLPAQLVATASRSKHPSPAEALLVQTAVAIELLLMLPMRRKNLAHLELDRHLIRSRKGALHLSIPGHEVKNGAAIDAILPPHMAALIELYVTGYRSLLITQASPFLFPGVADRPKSCERLALQISNTIKERCGLLINPHLFRHIAAKLYLEAYPGAYGVIRLLHGHRSLETTTRFYCGTEDAAAVKHYDAHVLHLRADLGKATSPNRRRQG